MSPNVYDQAARFAVQPDPIGFFRWLAPGLDEALNFLGWLDARTLPFPGDADRVCDSVAQLGTGDPHGPRWAVVTEFQSEPEPDILDRLLEYLARLRRALRHGPQRREKFPVVAAVLNLTGPPQPDSLEMGLPGLESPRLRLQVVVRTLRDEDAGATLEEIAAGRTSRSILAWISLMRGAGEPDMIERWKQVTVAEPDSTLRATYCVLALVFAELSGRAAPWRAGLVGWDMRESQIVSEWKAEGRAEGRAEGKVEGRAEGRAEGKRIALLRLLELRFQAPVPKDLATAISAQEDLEVLSAWFDRGVLASSLDEFRATIAPQS